MQNSKTILMQESLNKFKSEKYQLILNFTNFLKDTNVCLNERWNLFVTFGQGVLPYNYDIDTMLSKNHLILAEVKKWWGNDLAYDIVFENIADHAYDFSDDEVVELQELILATGYCGEDF